MAKRRIAPDEPEDPVGPPDPIRYNANDEEVLPGETPEEYMARRDEEESTWVGKHGGRGATRHDANEHRHQPKADEFYDPNMGSN